MRKFHVIILEVTFCPGTIFNRFVTYSYCIYRAFEYITLVGNHTTLLFIILYLSTVTAFSLVFTNYEGSQLQATVDGARLHAMLSVFTSTTTLSRGRIANLLRNIHKKTHLHSNLSSRARGSGSSKYQTKHERGCCTVSRLQCTETTRRAVVPVQIAYYILQ